MSSETTQAFDHPEARAAATAGPTPRDRISLRDHVVEVEIGAFQVERGTTQRVAFNIVVEVTPPAAGAADDVDRILSYDTLTEAIRDELAAQRLNLLETLAEGIATRILARPMAARVFVRIEKLDRGPGALGVEIVRSAPETAPQSGQGADQLPVAPHVIYLDAAAARAPALGKWLDAAADQPVVLCVGLPELARPTTKNTAAQRRIDLLAIEQSAWQLAGRDARCVVVDSRTELDWALRNRQICVWAPSKLVLDAHDGPQAANGPALARWLAERLEATDCVYVGDAPDAADTDTMRIVSAGAATLV